MKSLGRMALFIGGLLLIAVPANATSSRWVRSPLEANIAPCGGRLIEQVVEGGSVMSSYGTLALACMKSNSEAHWVLLSNANCGDRLNDQAGQCQTKAGRPAMNQIAAMARYADVGGLHIHLPRADLGRDCLSVTGRSGGTAHWECASYRSANGTDLRVRGGKFEETDLEAWPSVLGKRSNVPWQFPEGFESHILDRTVKEDTGPEPEWSGNSKYMRYGQPETDSLTTLECKEKGSVELVVDATRRLPPSVGRGNIFAMDRTEQADYRIRLRDGEQLVFQISTESIALSSLAAGKDFRIQLPNAEWAFVTGKGASKLASTLRAACSKPITPQLRPVQSSTSSGIPVSPIPTFVLPDQIPAPPPSASTAPRGVSNDDNTGWWVVLASKPDMRSRASSGGAEVDIAAARCGVHVFDDHSSKFEGFEAGRYIFTMGSRPFSERSTAEGKLNLIGSCFPEVRLVFGRYRSG